jgi:hypothetical protein
LNYKMSKIQNVENKNIELQNVKNYKTLNLTERQYTKRRILQNIEIQNIENTKTSNSYGEGGTVEGCVPRNGDSKQIRQKAFKKALKHKVLHFRIKKEHCLEMIAEKLFQEKKPK